MNKREFGCLCVAIENYLFFSPLSLLFIVFCLKMAKEEDFSSFFRLSLVIFFKNRVLNNIGDYVMKKSKKCTPPDRPKSQFKSPIYGVKKGHLEHHRSPSSHRFLGF